MDMNNKQEIITELEKFHQAKTRVENLEDYRQNVMPDESREEIKRKKKEFGTLENIPSIYDIEIEFYDYDVAKLNEKREKFTRRLVSQVRIEKNFFIILGVTGVCLLIFFTTHVEIFNYISVLGIFASIFMGLRRSQDKKSLKSEEEKYSNLLQKYNDSINKFNTALQSYEKDKAAGIEAAKEYGKKYREYYSEAEKIMEKYVGKIEEITREEFELMSYMSTFDLVDESYHHLIPRIVANLRSSRADTLKEALNLAIDEERQEQYEAQRRYEEEQRALREQMRIEAEQAEIRRHNLELEVQAAAQARAAQDAARAAERATEIAKRQAKMQEEEAREARRSAREARDRQDAMEYRQKRTCANCALYGKCAGGIVGCGSFVPKR